ncbi:MAG TPA: hypothetical protein VLB49_06930 [Gemmatimonadales bacterium]|nr:hypothetical protein [Gemmatimonadales bacterium]
MSHHRDRARPRWRWSAALVVVFFTACGDNGSSLFDLIAPAPITDLRITDSLGTSIVLTWTASGDDNQAGTAAEYDLRRAMHPITDANWNDADRVASVPDPAPSGTPQGVTATGLAWWTRYYFAIRIRDEAGNWSGLSNVPAASPYPEEGLRFLIRTRDNILAADMNGNVEPFVAGSAPVEVMGDRVYVSGQIGPINELDVNGSLIRTIVIPEGVPWHINFAALPGGRFALMSNEVDTVSFIDDAGHLLAATSIVASPDNELQNLDGVIVGNSLIISEDGYNHLLRADLNTYAIGAFYNLSYLSGWLGAIDYSDGYYYICQAQSIYRLDESGNMKWIATLGTDLYNITGVVVVGGYSFVTLNFAGAIYRVNNTTGSVTPFLEGLDYPEDLELIRR